jgi:hypothetical protein
MDRILSPLTPMGEKLTHLRLGCVDIKKLVAGGPAAHP